MGVRIPQTPFIKPLGVIHDVGRRQEGDSVVVGFVGIVIKDTYKAWYSRPVGEGNRLLKIGTVLPSLPNHYGMICSCTLHQEDITCCTLHQEDGHLKPSRAEQKKTIS